MKYTHIVDDTVIPSYLVGDFFNLLSSIHAIVLVIYFFTITSITFYVLRWKNTSFWPVIFGVMMILPIWWTTYFTGINSWVKVPDIHIYLFSTTFLAFLTACGINKIRSSFTSSSKKTEAPKTELMGPDISVYFE